MDEELLVVCKELSSKKCDDRWFLSSKKCNRYCKADWFSSLTYHIVNGNSYICLLYDRLIGFSVWRRIRRRLNCLENRNRRCRLWESKSNWLAYVGIWALLRRLNGPRVLPWRWVASKRGPTVAIGIYLRVLYALQLDEDILWLAKEDKLGRVLLNLSLKTLERASKKE